MKKGSRKAQDRTEYLKQYHGEHPEDQTGYKAKQRQKDTVWLFHIKREHFYGYPLPGFIAADPERCERMRARLAEQIAEPVEVETKEK